MCLGCTVTLTPVTSLLRNSCKDRPLLCARFDFAVPVNPTDESCCYRVEIQRDKQLDYLMNGLRQLSPSFSSLDAK